MDSTEALDRGRIEPGVEGHLRRLVQSISLLADLSRADVLVMRPDESGFAVIAHVRPINSRTVYPVDQVDTVMKAEDRPLVAHAFESGEIVDGGAWLSDRQRWIRTLIVPVRHRGRVVAVLAREFLPHIEEMPGDLELISFATFRRLASMIAAGSFPFGVDTRVHDHPPRVGDGVMMFDRAGRLEYASPNALTVMRQVGATQVNVGQRLGDMGIDAPGIRQAYSNRLSYTDEVEVGRSVLSTWCLPLLSEDVVTGALVLVRNISELRQRDRLLMTKDATIAEIHHRVKNSLQTISSLLHLQSRRVDSTDAQAALRESARRIRSIGVVHELLSRRTDDEVAFEEILRTLTMVIRDSLLDPSKPVDFVIRSDGAVLPNGMITSMSLVVSELLQNAIDHAECSSVTIGISTEPDCVELVIADNGVGFAAAKAASGGSGTGEERLGLTIVRTIIESELRGDLFIGENNPGALVRVRVPLYASGDTEV